MNARSPSSCFIAPPRPRGTRVAFVAVALTFASLVPADAQSVIIQGWLAANTECKGGVPDEPKTQKACKLRDALNDKLKRRKCEYHEDGDWWRCPH